MIRKMLSFRRTARVSALAAIAVATVALTSGFTAAPGASADSGAPTPPPGSGAVCVFYEGDELTVYGEQGDRVSQVQCMLANRHYLPWTAVDGTFGPRTLLAVQSFQADHPPLLPSGLVTPVTWSALWHAGPTRTSPLPYPPV
ncbi:peptidoglycan-binding protein [Streptomyces sp. NPDC052052]|uniref:peptidoglycan-binding domain-containing protein n=1 Tax=Streptomyces sp. NPDC052052 TaxID=3154756 RepID=UPI00342EFEE3